MNSYQQVYGMTAAGIEGGGTGSGGSNQNLKFRSSSHQLLQQAKVTIPQAILQVLFYCCRANGLLAKFPSRAKRIDVLSRFIFPLILISLLTFLTLIPLTTNPRSLLPLINLRLLLPAFGITIIIITSIWIGLI